ncbi:MAG: transposase [Bacteroidales bacterium]|jgi:transposase|nr:transposase [Bacteroidales bacterium]
MWDILPGTLYHWYRNHLSDYEPDRKSGEWPQNTVITVEENTGEILEEKPVYVFKPDNIGERMSIDDKSIGHEGYTIMSNTDTGKIAMLIESTRTEELEKAMRLFDKDLLKIRSISLDMSPTYLKLCHEQMPYAQKVVDKFHVMQYVYDAVLDVRSRIKKELGEKLSKGKEKTEQDKAILYEIELLKHCRYRLTQSPNKWSEAGKKLMDSVFENHKDLKTAYQISQDFKKWYDRSNCQLNKTEIRENLYKWYYSIKNAEIKEFISVVKMIRKHEYEILNFFSWGHTNAKAEQLNGKIQRFISANYGIRDKDFSLYRMAGYFS